MPLARQQTFDKWTEADERLIAPAARP